MELRTEVEIAAPPERIWQVLTDFPAYHEWNPFITSIAGELKVGSQLAVVISPPESGETRFSPEVVRCDKNRELRWRGKLWFDWLFTGEHFFQLQASGPDSTRVIHGEDFSGILVKLNGRMLTQTARGFVYMNRALKRRIERGESLRDLN